MDNIILDIDDVILQWTKGFSNYIGVDLTTDFRSIHQCLNITQAKENDIIEEFNTSESFSKIPYIDGAIEAVKKLHESYSVFFVTSCGDSPKTVDYRYRNLKAITEYGEIIFLPIHSPKDVVIADLKPVLYVDDNYSNVVAAQSIGAESYLFDTPWARRNGKTYIWKDILNEHYGI